MKASLQEKYKDIPERVIVIALESVDYDKNKAVQILEIMVKEEKNSPKTGRDKDHVDGESRYCRFGTKIFSHFQNEYNFMKPLLGCPITVQHFYWR